MISLSANEELDPTAVVFVGMLGQGQAVRTIARMALRPIERSRQHVGGSAPANIMAGTNTQQFPHGGHAIWSVE